jgi:large subunit ribosomal protein L10
MPNKKVLEKKKSDVAIVKEKFQKSNMVILSDYRGINVGDVTKIRGDLKKSGAEYLVTKNTILKFAAKEANIEGLDKYLEGPTAITFGSDYVSSAKILNDFAEKTDFYKIKAGVMDGKVISAEQVIKLAKLPSREMLLTQLATVLLANIRNVAVVLDQVREKKAAE